MNNGKSNVLHLTPPAPTSIPDPGVTAADRRVEIANARRPSAVRSGLGGSILAAAAIALGVVLALATYAAAQPAQPDAAVAVFDAAPSSPDAAVAAPAPHTTIDNPITNPVATWDDYQIVRKLGPWALLYFALYLLAMFAATLGQRREIKWLAWFGKGRVAVVFAGLGAVAAAGFDAIVLGGTPLAAGFAALVAALHFIRAEMAKKV